MTRIGWQLCGALLLAGCAASSAMRSHVPAHCHGASAPFTTFAIEQVEVPGFMTPVLADALDGALLRAGLEHAAAGSAPDVTLRARYAQVNRAGFDGDGQVAGRSDGFGEPVAAGSLVRFVAHLDLELLDNRDGALVWRATMDRPHAITGGETFHGDRARLLLATTLDRMLRGVRVPCPR